jgi:hypothetical protein
MYDQAPWSPWPKGLHQLSSSAFALTDDERRIARARIVHKRAIRSYANGNEKVKKLPGSGVPRFDEVDASLASIREIGDAYLHHQFAAHPMVFSLDGQVYDELSLIRDQRYPTDEGAQVITPDSSWPWYRHTDPIEACGLCADLAGCSVPCAGLSPASPPATLEDGPEIAKARWTRFKRRQRYHQKKKWRRDRGNVLTQRELAAAAHTERRADMCCSECVTLERRLPAAGVHLERIQVPMRCGLRRCGSCFDAKRQLAAPRMQGAWKQFVTITIPHDEYSRMHAWRNASRWMTELTERLQSRARRGRRQCVSWNCRDRAPHYEMDTQGKKLELAWVVEPHKDGFPHWHIAWSADYVCFDYLRECWDDVAGLGITHVVVRKVYDPESIARYMIYYLTKAVYPEEILAVCYRKRLWATTTRRVKKWELGYQIAGIRSSKGSSIEKDRPTLPCSSSIMGVGVKPSNWRVVLHVRGIVSKWELSSQSEWMYDMESRKYGSTPPDVGQEDSPSLPTAPMTSDVLLRSRKYLTPDFLDLERLERTWYDQSGR